MLWILRRTRGGLSSTAASLLNTLNNNNNKENRPAKKNYNKLSEEDKLPKTSDVEELDNDPNFKNNNRTGNASDSDSTFTDLELDDRDEFSDDSDYDEALTCNVCDRTFGCPKQLSSHKQKKRHFGCTACDSLFPSLMALEHHKEEFEHWSSDDDICTDTEDEDDDTVISEECERLL